MRTFADIVNSWLAQLDAANPEVSHIEGDEIYNVCLVPSANEFNRAYIIVDYVRRLTSLDKLAEILDDSTYLTNLAQALGKKEDGTPYTTTDVSNIISQDLDNIAANYNVTRPAGSLALSVFRFFINGNVQINLPDKSRVRTSGSTPLYYYTQGALTNETPQYDSSTGRYYIDVGVQSADYGSKYNVGSRIINLVDPPLTDILSGYNTIAATGGTDRMGDAAFIEYLKEVVRSREVGTFGGMKNLMIENGAVDAYPIGPENALMTRQDGGAVDIFVIANPTYLSFSERFIWTLAANGAAYYFQNQPVFEISLIKINNVAIATTYNTLVKDTGVYNGSTLGRDYWDISQAIADLVISDGDTVEIFYKYNFKIRQLQDVLALQENNLLESSNLVKEAEQLQVEFTQLPIAFLSGYDPAAVEAIVTTDLGIFFLGGVASTGKTYVGKKLGEDIDVSDLVNVITDVEGVDRVDLNALQITMGSQSYPTVNILTVSEYQYARLGAINYVEQT